VSRIEEAIERSDAAVLSLLFPLVESIEDLLAMLHAVLRLPQIASEPERAFPNGMTALALRMPIDGDGTLAWLMGFGPFAHIPETRQSPIAEIAIRLKPKPEQIFHRLNQDRSLAHLADVQLGIDGRRMEARWQGTLKRTQSILSGEPDDFSAAKVTFAVPTLAWHRVAMTA
jgi:hypothetical protein